MSARWISRASDLIRLRAKPESVSKAAFFTTCSYSYKDRSSSSLVCSSAVAEAIRSSCDDSAKVMFVVGAGASVATGSTIASILQFQRASASLERARRARIDRAMDEWESRWLSPLPPRRRPGKFGRLLDSLLRFDARIFDTREYLELQEEVHSFNAFLDDAHLHEAIARQSSQGSRWWFESWRRYALAALSLGLSPRELLALFRTAAVARAIRNGAKRSSRSADVDAARLRERLQNVIFPNAPAAAGRFRYLAAGDGLTTVRI
jgi:hypothetical protein